MKLVNSADPRSLSSRLRARRDVALRDLISAIHTRNGRVRIIDMGGTPEYWQRVGIDFLRSRNAKVTIVNLYEGELDRGDRNEDIFKFVVGNACDLENIADGSYDLAHSNSVIEHVQTWANMKAFAAETRRVAPYHYLQTPYFWFPVDPHFYKLPLFHWLPRPIRAKLLVWLPLAHTGRLADIDGAYGVVDGARLLDRAQMRFLFPASRHRFERFLGLPKSIVVILGPEGT